MISVYTTFPDEKSAKTLARELLESNLIACANILPGLSLYKWEGEIKEEAEVVMFVKSEEKNWEALKKMVLANHPYDVPAVIKFSVEAEKEYETWVQQETQPSGSHS